MATPTWADDGAHSLLGRWKWTDERPGETVTARMTPGQSFSRLEFLPHGKVVGFQYLAGAFNGGGEALESGYGRYRLRSSSLEITPPKHIDTTGWPNRDGVERSTYRCGFTEDDSSRRFNLAGCPLSGTWVRDEDVRR